MTVYTIKIRPQSMYAPLLMYALHNLVCMDGFSNIFVYLKLNSVDCVLIIDYCILCVCSMFFVYCVCVLCFWDCFGIHKIFILYLDFKIQR